MGRREKFIFFLCVYVDWRILRQSHRKGARSAVRDYPMTGRAMSRISTRALRTKDGGIIFVGSRKR